MAGRHVNRHQLLYLRPLVSKAATGRVVAAARVKILVAGCRGGSTYVPRVFLDRVMLLLAAAVTAQVTHSRAGFRDSDAGITKSRHPAAASGASHHSHHNADTASHHRAIHGGQSSAAPHADGSTTTPRKTVIIFRYVLSPRDLLPPHDPPLNADHLPPPSHSTSLPTAAAT